MKSLYKSILDDEEVLISNAIKDTNNPFQFVSALISDGDLLIRHKQEIEKLFAKFIKTIKPKHPIEIITQSNGIKLQIQHSDFDPLIILRTGNLWSKNDNVYGLPGDQKMVIFFSESFIEDYLYYGFKDETDYRHWIEMIAKKYNLNKSKKDPLVYYI